MTASPHDDHDRPSLADHRTALLVTRAILNGADLKAAHEAAAAGCPVCVAVAGISFGISLASTMAGDQSFTSEPVRQALLAAVDVTLRDLDTGGN